MKILLSHNYYQQPGGEDQVFADEKELLESRGHKVVPFTRHNDAIRDMASWRLARRTLWNSGSYREIRELIRRERPDVMHFHNTFPLISPSAYYAARAERVPVVQTLHNYRLLCPGATFLREGRVCEDCLGKRVAWPGVRHRCYRDSRAASLAVTSMLGLHRLMGTWSRKVDLYIALTEFAREKFIQGGIAPEKIVVKPNFVHPHPAPGTGRGGYAVFVGRLSPEKGVDTLLAAWEHLGDELPLKIIGDGPLAARVDAATRQNPGIRWLGRQPFEKTVSMVGEAVLLVMPSVWYETFGRTIVEAFARATPVVASRMGAMAELVDHGRTGVLFDPGDSGDLTSKVRELTAQPDLLASMRQAARREFEAKYTAARNYETLMAIYNQVVAMHGKRPD
jgi:glycosyltransferase involved in cell wall biosynthesis